VSFPNKKHFLDKNNHFNRSKSSMEQK